MVVIYHGNKKPKDINGFLAGFIEDIVNLRAVGIQFQGKNIKEGVSGLCSDAATTSFALSIVPHNAYYGFLKCTTKVLWVFNSVTCHTQPKTGGRVTYTDLDAPLRTDESFWMRAQKKHYNRNNNRSIVENIY